MTDGARIQAPAVMLYGPSGIGKTLAALRALTPERTLWISTERGAQQRCFSHDSLDKLYPTKDRWGIVPDRGNGSPSGLMPMDLGAILRAGTALDCGRSPRAEDLAVLRSFESGEGVGL